jgi:hypothetical protein
MGDQDPNEVDYDAEIAAAEADPNAGKNIAPGDVGDSDAETEGDPDFNPNQEEGIRTRGKKPALATTPHAEDTAPRPTVLADDASDVEIRKYFGKLLFFFGFRVFFPR